MVKLSTLSEAYIKAHPDLAFATRQITKRAFGWLVIAVGDILIDNMTFGHAEAFRNWLRQSGREKTTTNIYTRAISPVFGWAVLNGWLATNPVKGLGQLKVTRNPNKVYTDAEFERLYKCANDLWKGRLLAARYHGLRLGEVLNLTMDNIRNGSVFVEPKRENSQTWHWEPKDRELREVPLSPELGQWLIRQGGRFYPFLSSVRLATMYQLLCGGLLTDDVRNKPDPNAQRDFRKLQKKAFGQRRGTFHDLRKTYTTDMLEVLPAHYVARLTGHANVRTLVTHYAGSKESYFEKAREIVSGAHKKGQQTVSTGPMVKLSCA